jgi:hypothetical protein
MLSYTDCKDFLERALDADRGARIAFPQERQAEFFRMRCNQFRALDRKNNRIVFPDPGDKMHGQSEYDLLTMRIKFSPDGLYWVYAEKVTLKPEAIEDIPEDEASLLVEYTEVKSIEDHSDDHEVTK